METIHNKMKCEYPGNFTIGDKVIVGKNIKIVKNIKTCGAFGDLRLIFDDTCCQFCAGIWVVCDANKKGQLECSTCIV